MCDDFLLHRNKGNGFTLCLGRIGAILAPFMLYMVSYSYYKLLGSKTIGSMKVTRMNQLQSNSQINPSIWYHTFDSMERVIPFMHARWYVIVQYVNIAWCLY